MDTAILKRISSAGRRSFLKDVCVGLGAMTMARHANAEEGAPCSPIPAARVAAVGPGQKFATDGRVQRFPGNTVLCHIPRPGPAFDELCSTVDSFRQALGSETASKLTWLPKDSYHVTLFDGVTDAFRRPGDWPQMLPLDATMDVCNQYVGERLRKFDVALDLPLRLIIDEDALARSVTTIPLRPIDAAENVRLRTLRDRISVAIGVRHANHDSYGFHTTFAYYVRQFTGDEEARYRARFTAAVQRLKKALPVIELGAPEYCLFDDMFAFHRQFFLKQSASKLPE